VWKKRFSSVGKYNFIIFRTSLTKNVLGIRPKSNSERRKKVCTQSGVIVNTLKDYGGKSKSLITFLFGGNAMKFPSLLNRKEVFGQRVFSSCQRGSRETMVLSFSSNAQQFLLGLSHIM
jgi:hypothetical protein